MRRTLLYTLGTALVLSAAGCSEKFDVAAPYKNVTIVTAFMDISDTAHYIRIQKGFMDNNNSAIDMEKVSDSSFYANADLDVKMKELIPGNQVPLSITTLNRVNMADEGYPKTSGSFFTTPSYSYKYKAALNPAHTYRVVITNNKSHEVDSAETGIIDTSFSNFNISSYPTFRIAKKDDQGYYQFDVHIVSPDTNNVAPAGIKEIECTMLFYYRDSFASGTIVSHEPLRWTNIAITKAPTEILSNNTSVNVHILNTLFYDFLQQNLSPVSNKSDQFRKIDSMTLIVYAGSKAYSDYKKYAGSTGGLTGSEIKPNYSNIKGGTVLGLYSTRAKRDFRGLKFDNYLGQTYDSLAADPRTKGLNLVP